MVSEARSRKALFLSIESLVQRFRGSSEAANHYV